jgi:hypothetical protein
MDYPKFLFIVFLMFSSVSWGQTYKPSDLRQIFQEHRDNAANFATIYRGRQFNGVMKITEIKERDYNPRSNTAFHVQLENENKLRVSCYAKTQDEIENISIFKVGQKVIVTGVMNRAYQPSLLSLDQCLFSDPKYDLEQYCKSNKVYDNGILKSCFGVAKFQPCNVFHCDEIGKTTGIFERKYQGSDLSFGRTYVSENKDATKITVVIQDSKKNNERYVISYSKAKKDKGDEYFQFFKERENVVDGRAEGTIVGTIVESKKKKNKWGDFGYGVPCKADTESTYDYGYAFIEYAYNSGAVALQSQYHDDVKNLIANVSDFIRRRHKTDGKIGEAAKILSLQAEKILESLLQDPEFALNVQKEKERYDYCDYR